jgi:general secretion pathway protein E
MADSLDGHAIGAMQLFADKPVKPWSGCRQDRGGAERLYGRGGAHEIVQAVGGPASSALMTTSNAARSGERSAGHPVVNRMIRARSRRAPRTSTSVAGAAAACATASTACCEVDAPPSHLCAAIISRIKIMARLTSPSAARPRTANGSRSVARHRLRVATMLTMYGESVAFRVPDRGSVVPDFTALA